MDASGLMMASGGMVAILFSILMMALPLIMVLLIWRVLKWTATTASEMSRLNEQMGYLVELLQQGGVPAAPAAKAAPAPEPDPFAEEDADQGFDFSAMEDEEDTAEAGAEMSFGMEEAEDLSADMTSSQAANTEADAGLADDSAFGEAEGFDFDLESGAEDEETDESAAESAGEFSFDMGSEEEEFGAREFGAEESPDSDLESLAAAFAAETEETTKSAAFPEEPPAPAAAPEEPPAATQPSEEESAAGEELPEPAVEEKPAIIPLDPDPRRPAVNLARCGQCGHKLAYKESLSGKRARCPSCQAAFVLP